MNKKTRKWAVKVYDWYYQEPYAEFLKDKLFYTRKQAVWWFNNKSNIDYYKNVIFYTIGNKK